MVCVRLSTAPNLYSTVPLYFFAFLLSVTSLGRAQLRLLPLAKLRRYINAYNIPIKIPIDKNDLVDAAVAARVGCRISRFVESHTPFLDAFTDLSRLSVTRKRGLL